MRIKNTLKNSAYAIMSYATIAVLALLIRRFFLDRLPTEYLGYEGLFGDIFAVLSIADLGIASVINYRLYPAIEEADNESVSRLMSVYKFLYRIVGIGVLTVGLLLIPFLKYIIKDNQYDWNYVYLVYLLQLATSLCTYFLAYKRVLLIAHQREAECIKVDWICTIIANFIKMAVILILGNYLLYLAVSVINNIVTNWIISKKVDRSFDKIDCNRKINIEDVKNLELGKDIKNNLVQKICLAIYGGTDSILISSILGIAQVGLMSNYHLISGYVTTVLTKLLNPFQAAISNYVYDSNIENHDRMFFMFDRIGFFMACFISIAFFVLFNPFITLIFGEKYVLGELFVLAFAINQYIAYNHKFVCFYRNSFGKFEVDKYYTLIAAVLNIVLSIVLARYIGIAGIMFGTVIGHMGFWIGRVKVVYSEYMDEKVYLYIIRQSVNLCVWLLEMLGTYYLCSFFSNGFKGFIGKVTLCLIIPNLCNLIIFFRTPSVLLIREYIGKTIHAIGTTNGK